MAKRKSTRETLDFSISDSDFQLLSKSKQKKIKKKRLLLAYKNGEKPKNVKPINEKCTSICHAKMVVEYDGSKFHGFQSQLNMRTVQDVLEEKLQMVFQTQDRIVVQGASRTDRGVHAEGQVACVRVKEIFPLEKLCSSLNSHLPDDVVVRSMEKVDPNFDVRYDSKCKMYTYRIRHGCLSVRSVLQRHITWDIKNPLDIEKMNKATKLFEGEHDFTCFTPVDKKAISKEDIKTNICVISSMKIVCADGNSDRGSRGEIINIEVIGNRFLYHMVRILVGILVQVGLGCISVEEIPLFLSPPFSTNPIYNYTRNGACTAPPHGLTLKWIQYEQVPSI